MTRLFASSSSSSSQHASPRPAYESLDRPHGSSDAFIPPPPPEPAPRRGFQRFAAALRRRRQTVSNSPAGGVRRGASQTSSIASTASTVSTDESHELHVPDLPPVPRITSAPTPPPSFASKPRLRYSQSQRFHSPGSPYWMDSLNMPAPQSAAAAEASASEEVSGSSTPFLPNMDKEKLTPCQRQMYEKLRLVNERLLLESQGPAEKRRTTH